MRFSSSTQFAPALMRSVLIDGHDVSVLPAAMFASASIHPAWQIAATGFSASKILRVRSTMPSLVRILSGEYPPGITRAA
jgi:hypothetical protein